MSLASFGKQVGGMAPATGAWRFALGGNGVFAFVVSDGFTASATVAGTPPRGDETSLTGHVEHRFPGAV